MPVITLTVSWHSGQALPSKQAGWRFEMCGDASSSIDMRCLKFVQSGTAPYFPGNLSEPECWGPIGWLLTPDQNELLGKCCAASITDPPMALATRVLEALEAKGYHVVGTHSSSTGGRTWTSWIWNQNESVTYIWTLRKEEKAIIQSLLPFIKLMLK